MNLRVSPHKVIAVVFWAPVVLFGLWIALLVTGPVIRVVVPIVAHTVGRIVQSR